MDRLERGFRVIELHSTFKFNIWYATHTHTHNVSRMPKRIRGFSLFLAILASMHQFFSDVFYSDVFTFAADTAFTAIHHAKLTTWRIELKMDKFPPLVSGIRHYSIRSM